VGFLCLFDESDGFCLVQLNGNRKVEGVLRGYDQFMNIVLEDCVEKLGPMNDKEIGTVVSFFFL
jgi:small nuclear ribonucleoprotein (snRNP)-like protein